MQALKCMLLAKVMMGDSSEVPAIISSRGSLKHAGSHHSRARYWLSWAHLLHVVSPSRRAGSL